MGFIRQNTASMFCQLPVFSCGIRLELIDLAYLSLAIVALKFIFIYNLEFIDYLVVQVY